MTTPISLIFLSVLAGILLLVIRANGGRGGGGRKGGSLLEINSPQIVLALSLIILAFALDYVDPNKVPIEWLPQLWKLWAR